MRRTLRHGLGSLDRELEPKRQPGLPILFNAGHRAALCTTYYTHASRRPGFRDWHPDALCLVLISLDSYLLELRW